MFIKFQMNRKIKIQNYPAKAFPKLLDLMSMILLPPFSGAMLSKKWTMSKFPVRNGYIY